MLTAGYLRPNVLLPCDCLLALLRGQIHRQLNTPGQWGSRVRNTGDDLG